jgi:outer membrane protein OmpA-like peptidoglycan-associated protein
LVVLGCRLPTHRELFSGSFALYPIARMSTKKDSYWIPLADLMTVLMVIFLFMSLSYMVGIKKRQEEKDHLIEEFQNSKTDLLQEIKVEFKEDFKQTKWNAVLDTSNLSIRFVDERILFDYDKADIKEEFKSILTEFFPRYLNIILQKKYADKIAEVRIEGHTSTEGGYIYNLKLSQDRTRNVMEFLMNLDCYKNLDSGDKKRLEYLLTANGLSYGRSLDKNGRYTYNSNDSADNLKCRRVEFRILTTSDELIKKAINNINK